MSAESLSDGAPPRALITGLRGFPGHYLARELEAAGYRVFGTAYGVEAVGENVHTVDLCDRDALTKLVAAVQPDVVAHLAGISFAPHGDAEAIYRVNVVGTRNLLEALTKCGKTSRAVLLASSANVYGNAVAELIDERVPPVPENDYAVSKLAMEHMARLWFTYADLDDLNAQAQAWCVGQAADRPCPEDTAMRVREAFAAEQPHLLPVPDNPYPTEERVAVKAGKTPCVRYDLNDYSLRRHYTVGI